MTEVIATTTGTRDLDVMFLLPVKRDVLSNRRERGKTGVGRKVEGGGGVFCLSVFFFFLCLFVFFFFLEIRIRSPRILTQNL